MVAAGSKCRTCRGPAIIDLPRHNANFCAEHFMELCRRQVSKAIDHFKMIDRGDRVLVAVSGGKDSLAVWDLLLELGYQADGLYVGLGIGEYSDTSADYARAFAVDRGLHLIEIKLRDEYGYTSRRLPRPPDTFPVRHAGSASGTSSTRPQSTVATTFSSPVTISTTKPLCCSATPCTGMSNIWPAVACARSSCGLSQEGQAIGSSHRARDGNLVHRARHRLPRRRMPDGSRQQAPWVQSCSQRHRGDVTRNQGRFLLQLHRAHGAVAGRSSVADGHEVGACSNCGAPTTGNVSAFCRLVETASAHAPVPVDLVMKKGRGRR